MNNNITLSALIKLLHLERPKKEITISGADGQNKAYVIISVQGHGNLCYDLNNSLAFAPSKKMLPLLDNVIFKFLENATEPADFSEQAYKEEHGEMDNIDFHTAQAEAKSVINAKTLRL